MKWENVEKKREGEDTRVCPARLREEGGRGQLSSKLRELFIPVQRWPPWSALCRCCDLCTFIAEIGIPLRM